MTTYHYDGTTTLSRGLRDKARCSPSSLDLGEILDVIGKHGDRGTREVCIYELLRRYSIQLLVGVTPNPSVESHITRKSSGDVIVMHREDPIGSIYMVYGYSDKSVMPYKPNSRGNRGALQALLYACEEYGPVVYRVDSEYVYNVFTLWLRGWKNNGYKTKKGEGVRNRDIIEALISKGIDAPNVAPIGKSHTGIVAKLRAFEIPEGCI